MSEIITVKPNHIQILGVILSAVFGGFILFIYAVSPHSFGELRTKAGETVEKAISSGQVLAGTYKADESKFQQGLALFRSGDYPGARALFSDADPEKRDGKTQFYTAYSFYRQGWGKFSSDDELFRQGAEAAQRAQSLSGGSFISDDADLKLKTPAALKNELEEGSKITPGDFNPARALNERK